MKNIAENNLIRFINITKKKDGMFANFKVKGITRGNIIYASISVDIWLQRGGSGDPLEKIIEHCATHGCQRIQKIGISVRRASMPI